jgi:hypothetical protein
MQGGSCRWVYQVEQSYHTMRISAILARKNQAPRSRFNAGVLRSASLARAADKSGRADNSRADCRARN